MGRVRAQGGLGRERKLHPAAGSRAPRLNGPKKGPGSHLLSAPGGGRRQAAHPQGLDATGPGCGALFRTRPELLPRRLPRADSPGSAGWGASGATPPEVLPGPGPGLRQLTRTRCPRRAEKPPGPPRAPQLWRGPQAPGFIGTCCRGRRKAGRPRPRGGVGGRCGAPGAQWVPLPPFLPATRWRGWG